MELLTALKPSVKIYVQCKDEVDYNEIETKLFAMNKSLYPENVGTNNVIEKVSYMKSNNEFYIPFEFNV
jgi:hypothetical protein